MCLPSCASLPLTAAVSVRTFLLHFKAPRRLMSYPGIMKGETLLGFEIGAERVSSSHLFLFPLSSPRVQGTPQHFHLDGSSTGLRIGRCSDWTRCFLSFFLYHLQINPWSCLFDPLKTGTNTSHCVATLLRCFANEEQRRLLLLQQQLDSSSSWLLSSACISLACFNGTVH